MIPLPRRPLPALLLSRFIRSAAVPAAALALLLGNAPPAFACACGCGIYEVGTSSMLPTDQGVTAFLNYYYQDQYRNWSGTAAAPAGDNPDKDIRTSFLTFAYQQVFSRTWAVRLEVPYLARHFETTGGATGSDQVNLDFGGLGDLRLEGIYTTADREAGLTFGLKLPTGSFTTNDAYGDIDRDTEIGSGSTDALLGLFRRFALTQDLRWNEFAQVLLDAPVLTQSQYRPGAELDAAAGVYFDGWSLGRVRIAPIAEVKVSVRGRDSGANASSPAASGFTRVLVAPGVELDARPFKLSAELGITAFQRMTGNQLTAPVSLRLSAACAF